MSDDVIKIIPTDPSFVPGNESIQKAKEIFADILPKADEINVIIEDNIVFVDPGNNLEHILCPFCGAGLDDWWNEVMDKASETDFSNLKVTVPCCKKMTTLNDLRYEWPAGFGRFIMEARNPNILDIDDKDLQLLESVFRCKLREIRAHY